MNPVLLATIVGLVAGVAGTGLGGAGAAALVRPKRNVLSGALGFSAGAMLAILAFSLVPQALRVGGLGWTVAGLVAGVGLVSLIDLVVPHVHAFSGDRESARFLATGAVIGLGIAMHNLPEGMAIGAAYARGTGPGLAVAVAIALQNVPEGVAMGLPLVAGRVAPLRVVGATLLAGLPMGAGGALGAALGSLSPAALAVALGLAAGAMLFITGDELMPAAHEMGRGHQAAFGLVAGVIVGTITLSWLG